jgi:hypothetical protein
MLQIRFKLWPAFDHVRIAHIDRIGSRGKHVYDTVQAAPCQ